MENDLKTKLFYKIKEKNEIQYIFTDFKDSLTTEIITSIKQGEIHLVKELYRTEEDYSKTLFGYNLKNND